MAILLNGVPMDPPADPWVSLLDFVGERADLFRTKKGINAIDTALYFHTIGIMKSTDAVEALSALAQESRLALFRILVKRGPAGYTPTQLGEKLEVPGPTLSFHLKELQRAGLIEARREGRFLFYSPNFSRMNELIGFLTDNCCSLADKDCSPGACGIPATEIIPPKRKRA